MDWTPDDGGDAEDIMGIRSARDVGRGPVQSEQDLAVRVARAICWTSLLPILPEFRSGKISTLARPATLLSGSLRAAISGNKRGVQLQFAVEIGFENLLFGLLLGEGGGGLDASDGRVSGATFGRIGKQRHARTERPATAGRAGRWRSRCRRVGRRSVRE